MDVSDLSLKARARAAYQARLAAEQTQERERLERWERERAEEHARWAEMTARALQEVLDVEAIPLPRLGLALADGLYFRADYEDDPHGGPSRWNLRVYQPCQLCGGPASWSTRIESLADLGCCLESWQAYAVRCAGCQPEPAAYPWVDDAPASPTEPLAQIVDAIGAALRDRGWIA